MNNPEEILIRLKRGDSERYLSNKLLSELHKGFRIDSISELLESENCRAKDTGAFLLHEMAHKAQSLRKSAVKLSQSADAKRRKIFVDYCINSKLVDDEIVELISEILDDMHVFTRCSAINWILKTESENAVRMGKFMNLDSKIYTCGLEEISDIIDIQNRKVRAYIVGLLVKRNFNIRLIMRKILYEDSFTYSYLIRAKTTHRKFIRPFELR